MTLNLEIKEFTTFSNPEGFINKQIKTQIESDGDICFLYIEGNQADNEESFIAIELDKERLIYLSNFIKSFLQINP
jgi:hypothetical protein